MSDDDRDEITQSDQTRNRLLDAGLNLLATHGYRGAVTREIAREAGVTEVTMYRHFRSKDELFSAAINRRSEQILDRVPDPSGDIEADLMLLANGFLEHVSTLPAKMVRIRHAVQDCTILRELVNEVMSRFRLKTMVLLRHYQQLGELDPNSDDVIFEAFVGPVYMASMAIRSGKSGFDTKRYVEYFLRGFSSKQ